MKARSPVLGYNHNVRYAERLWHVQTEDSGVQSPHVFTHLFHDGTILATKRLDYDPSSEVIAVQKLMQTQHKAMLRELKAGAFDEKIGKYLGTPVVHKEAPTAPADPDATPSGVELAEPRPLEGPVEPFEEPPTDRSQMPQLDTDPNLAPPSPPPPVAVTAQPEAARTLDTDRKLTVPPPSEPKLTPPRPAPVTAPAPRPTLPPLRPPVRPATGRELPVQRPASSAAVPRPAPSGIGGRRPSTGAVPYGSKPSAEGVVVARPAVIIGGDSSRRPEGAKPAPAPSGRWQRPAPPVNAAPPAADKGGQDNIFGGDLISEKSLDEVILAYLSEDLNEK